MKKTSNIVCAVLIIIGLFVSIGYAGHKETNEFKEKYENGAYVTDENGKGTYVQYFDVGKTKKSRETERKIYAFIGFAVYAGVIFAAKYYFELKKKTKEEIMLMEKTGGDLKL